MALNVDLALILLYFLIGVFCGYALFGTQPVYKFNINLHKDGNKPLLPKEPYKLADKTLPTISKQHESKVDEQIKKAKEHFKNLGGNA